MRFAERGGVLRRVPSFAGLELQRTGKLLKLAAGGVVISTERELRAQQTGW
jgi:hypothetical protein